MRMYQKQVHLHDCEICSMTHINRLREKQSRYTHTSTQKNKSSRKTQQKNFETGLALIGQRVILSHRMHLARQLKLERQDFRAKRS